MKGASPKALATAILTAIDAYVHLGRGAKREAENDPGSAFVAWSYRLETAESIAKTVRRVIRNHRPLEGSVLPKRARALLDEAAHHLEGELMAAGPEEVRGNPHFLYYQRTASRIRRYLAGIR